MNIFPFKKKVEVKRIREVDGEKKSVTETVDMDQLTVDLLMEQGNLLNQINENLKSLKGTT